MGRVVVEGFDTEVLESLVNVEREPGSLRLTVLLQGPTGSSTGPPDVARGTGVGIIETLASYGRLGGPPPTTRLRTSQSRDPERGSLGTRPGTPYSVGVTPPRDVSPQTSRLPPAALNSSTSHSPGVGPSSGSTAGIPVSVEARSPLGPRVRRIVSG